MTQALPTTRPALLKLHAEARQRRDKAAPGGPEYRQACEDVASIEVQIALVEQPAAKPAPVAPAATKAGA